jgi:hypothetical protein
MVSGSDGGDKVTDLELLSLLKVLGSVHDVALSEIVNGQQTMMLALEKLFAVHSFSLAEIQRLRAKTNRLIRVVNSGDADGDHICNPRALSADLVLEEGI